MAHGIKLHDISMTLTKGMVSYPKDVPYQRTLQRDMQKGDPSNVSQFEMSAHSGTHVDAPLHFVPTATVPMRYPYPIFTVPPMWPTAWAKLRLPPSC